MRKREDHTGKKFNLLLVLERIEQIPGKKAKYLCQCDCGNKKIVSSSSLVTGRVKSCGCLRKKHGFARKERLYNIWKGMRQRCNDINSKDYPVYGGRGIKVCDEWDDYLVFRSWALANGYNDTLSIDRINSDGCYEPLNCRWETMLVQNNNKTNNSIISYNGEYHTIAEWSRIIGISPITFKTRLSRGWGVSRIIETPVKRGA